MMIRSDEKIIRTSAFFDSKSDIVKEINKQKKLGHNTVAIEAKVEKGSMYLRISHSKPKGGKRRKAVSIWKLKIKALNTYKYMTKNPKKSDFVFLQPYLDGFGEIHLNAIVKE